MESWEVGASSRSVRELYRRLAFGAPRLVVSFVTLALVALALFIMLSVR